VEILTGKDRAPVRRTTRGKARVSRELCAPATAKEFMSRVRGPPRRVDRRGQSSRATRKRQAACTNLGMGLESGGRCPTAHWAKSRSERPSPRRREVRFARRLVGVAGMGEKRRARREQYSGSVSIRWAEPFRGVVRGKRAAKEVIMSLSLPACRGSLRPVFGRILRAVPLHGHGGGSFDKQGARGKLRIFFFFFFFPVHGGRRGGAKTWWSGRRRRPASGTDERGALSKQGSGGNSSSSGTPAQGRSGPGPGGRPGASNAGNGERGTKRAAGGVDAPLFVRRSAARTLREELGGLGVRGTARCG